MSRVAQRVGEPREAARVGAGTRIRGRVIGEGNVSIEGHVEGDVDLRGGDLSVAEGGEVTATSVSVAGLLVSGSLRGDVRAEGNVHVSQTGSLVGNVRAESLSLDDGASFDGTLESDFELPSELLAMVGEKPVKKR